MDKDKDCLLGKLVDYNQDSVKSRGRQKFFNEVHRNGILWSFRDGELFERFVGLVTLWFGLHTSDTELAELLYISIEAGPGVSAAD